MMENGTLQTSGWEKVSNKKNIFNRIEHRRVMADFHKVAKPAKKFTNTANLDTIVTEKVQQEANTLFSLEKLERWLISVPTLPSDCFLNTHEWRDII